METKIVAIGNSQGVRIPKAVLRQSKLDPSRPVHLQVREHAIVIGQVPHPRAGWEESFKKKRPRKPENLWGALPVDDGWDK
jgi:antitoxin MazE